MEPCAFRLKTADVGSLSASRLQRITVNSRRDGRNGYTLAALCMRGGNSRNVGLAQQAAGLVLGMLGVDRADGMHDDPRRGYRERRRDNRMTGRAVAMPRAGRGEIVEPGRPEDSAAHPAAGHKLLVGRIHDRIGRQRV